MKMLELDLGVSEEEKALMCSLSGIMADLSKDDRRNFEAIMALIDIVRDGLGELGFTELASTTLLAINGITDLLKMASENETAKIAYLAMIKTEMRSIIDEKIDQKEEEDAKKEQNSASIHQIHPIH